MTILKIQRVNDFIPQISTSIYYDINFQTSFAQTVPNDYINGKDRSEMNVTLTPLLLMG